MRSLSLSFLMGTNTYLRISSGDMPFKAGFTDREEVSAYSRPKPSAIAFARSSSPTIFSSSNILSRGLAALTFLRIASILFLAMSPLSESMLHIFLSIMDINRFAPMQSAKCKFQNILNLQFAIFNLQFNIHRMLPTLHRASHIEYRQIHNKHNGAHNNSHAEH